MSQPAAITEPMVRRILITNDDGINAPGLAILERIARNLAEDCLLYTSPSPRDLSTSRMPSSA